MHVCVQTSSDRVARLLRGVDSPTSDPYALTPVIHPGATDHE